MYTDVRKLFEDLPSAVATALSQVRGRRGGGRASHGGGRREGEGARVQADRRCKQLVGVALQAARGVLLQAALPT